MKLIDLTHTFNSSMPAYPGDPKSTLVQTAFINKDSYNDHRLETQMHVGTHMDAPMHMIENGKIIDELSIDSFIGKGVIVNAFGKKEIGVDVLEDVEITNENIVLVYSGFDKKYRSENYFTNSPFITTDFAKKIIENKIKLLGLDFSGPDIDNSWPVHKIILGAQIPIVENLTNLDKLLCFNNYEIIALPAKLNADAAPTRVIAKVDK